MSQQPIAFTLVKTVVTAKDEGRALDPAIHTAWDMLREELGTPVQHLTHSVTWDPGHQEELRQMIDAVRDCFEADPALETEIKTLIDERERIGRLAAVAYPKPDDLPEESPEESSEPPLSEEPSELVDTGSPEEREPAEDAGQMESRPDLPADYFAESVPASSVAASPTATPELDPILASLTSIPMIVLDEDLSAEFDASEADEPPPLANAAPSPHRTSPATTITTAAADRGARMFATRDSNGAIPPDAMPVVHKIPYQAIPEPVRRPATNRDLTWLYWLLGGLALLLFATAVYLTFRTPTDATSESTAVPGAETPVSLAVATAPRVAELRESGDLIGARAHQDAYVKALADSNAPAELRAEALAQLASLAALTDAHLHAVTAQLQSLELTKEVAGVDSPAAADAHLKLASYYLDNGEPQMADAHFKQGRRLLTADGSQPSPEQASQIAQLSDRLTGKY